MYSPAHCAFGLCNVLLIFFPLRRLVLFWSRQNLYLMLPLLTDSLVPEKGEPLCPVQPLKCYHKPLPFQISAWSCGIEFVFFPHQECSGPCCSPLMMSGSLCGAVVVYTRQKSLQTQALSTFPLMSFHTQV